MLKDTGKKNYLALIFCKIERQQGLAYAKLKRHLLDRKFLRASYYSSDSMTP